MYMEKTETCLDYQTLPATRTLTVLTITQAVTTIFYDKGQPIYSSTKHKMYKNKRHIMLD
jgi:hypothetical protein